MALNYDEARLTRIEESLKGLTGDGKWGITNYNGGFKFNGPDRAYCGTNGEFGEPRTVPHSEADNRFVADAPADMRWLAGLVKLQRDQIAHRETLIATLTTDRTRLQASVDALTRLPDLTIGSELTRMEQQFKVLKARAKSNVIIAFLDVLADMLDEDA